MSAFLFDLDGVLVDTHAIVIAGWRRFGEARGRRYSDDEIVARMFGRRTIDILIDDYDVPPDEAELLLAAGIADKRQEVLDGPGLAEIPGAASFVRQAIADGIASALVSSASRANIDIALETLGLVGSFGSIVDEQRVGSGKPAPDPYLRAAADLGVDPRQAVVFEDTAPGIESGLAAGARVVGVATLGRPEAVARADLVIDDFRKRTPGSLLAELPARPVEGGSH